MKRVTHLLNRHSFSCPQAVLCDQCHKFVPAQYHLTMSDASVRNFCSYACVMQFQSQFTSTTPKSAPLTQHLQTQQQKQKQLLDQQAGVGPNTVAGKQKTITRSGRVVNAKGWWITDFIFSSVFNAGVKYPSPFQNKGASDRKVGHGVWCISSR